MKKTSSVILGLFFVIIVFLCAFKINVPNAMEEDETIGLDLPSGWSMFSLPVLPANPVLYELFPEAKVVYGYEKGKGYFRVKEDEDLKPGKGYWILLNGAEIKSLTGQRIQEYPLSVDESGWEMIGGCSFPAQVSTNSGNINAIYGFTPEAGYQRVPKSEKLLPGKGYWISLGDRTTLRVDSGWPTGEGAETVQIMTDPNVISYDNNVVNIDCSEWTDLAISPQQVRLFYWKDGFCQGPYDLPDSAFDLIVDDENDHVTGRITIPNSLLDLYGIIGPDNYIKVRLTLCNLQTKYSGAIYVDTLVEPDEDESPMPVPNAGITAFDYYFLPIVCNVTNGRKSYVMVRNLNETRSAYGTIFWYMANGKLWPWDPSTSFTVNPSATVTVQPPSKFSGSAAVTTGTDSTIAVIVRQEKADTISAYSAISSRNVGTGWGEPGNTIYTPVAMWHPWGSTWRTTLQIRNLGPGTATFSIIYRNEQGDRLACSREGLTLPINGSGNYEPTSCDVFVGSCKIISNQPLAVVVSQTEDTVGVSQYNAFSYGDREFYLPSMMRTWYGWDGSFSVQNLTDTNAQVRIRYVRGNGAEHVPPILHVPANGSSIVVSWDANYGLPEDNWHGAVTLTSVNGQAIAVVVNHALVSELRNNMSYSGYINGGNMLYGPFVGNSYQANGFSYDSASDVQNLASVTTSVVRRYYDMFGLPVYTTPSSSILPGANQSFWLPGEGVPTGFGGSVKITRQDPSNLIVTGIHNIARLIGNQPAQGDYAASYNMVQVCSKDAIFVSYQNVPSTMEPGKSCVVSVTMRNTGSCIWTKAQNYKLGSQNPQDNYIWGLNRVNLSDNDSIFPGMEKTFTFTITAPASPETYNFQWGMLQENVTWFGKYSTNVEVKVENPSITINPIEYMRNISGRILQDPKYKDIQKFCEDINSRRFWYMKNPYSAQRWEEYHWDDQYIWLERDTTWPDGNGSTAYDTYPWPDNMRMAKTYNWKLNDCIDSNFFVRGFNFLNNGYPKCSYQCAYFWPMRRKLVYHHPNFNLGGNLTNVDVIVIQTTTLSEFVTAVERHWYARDIGYVRWQHWDNPSSDQSFYDIPNANPDKDRILNTDISLPPSFRFQSVCDKVMGVTYQAYIPEKWQEWVYDGMLAGTTGQSQRMEAIRIKMANKGSALCTDIMANTELALSTDICYQVHVKNLGWLDPGCNGSPVGLPDQDLRIEAIKIWLQNPPSGYHIKYQAHVQNIGWMEWKYDGEEAGTTGQGLRMEAIKVLIEAPSLSPGVDVTE